MTLRAFVSGVLLFFVLVISCLLISAQERERTAVLITRGLR